MYMQQFAGKRVERNWEGACLDGGVIRGSGKFEVGGGDADAPDGLIVRLKRLSDQNSQYFIEADIASN